jgi:Ca2+-binding RTX toxin-like protein
MKISATDNSDLPSPKTGAVHGLRFDADNSLVPEDLTEHALVHSWNDDGLLETTGLRVESTQATLQRSFETYGNEAALTPVQPHETGSEFGRLVRTQAEPAVVFAASPDFAHARSEDSESSASARATGTDGMVFRGITIEQMTSLYLYGSIIPPSSIDTDSLIRDASATTEINADAVDYMVNGGGRYAVLSAFEIVQKFFDTANGIPPGVYGKAEIGQLFGLKSYGFNMLQLDYDPGSEDYAQRVYIWNSSAFKLSNDVEFHVESDGTRFLRHAAVVPNDLVTENFDFESSSFIATLGNKELELRVDPSGIGRKVGIKFVNDELVPRADYYGFEMFNSERATAIKPEPFVTPFTLNDLYDSLVAATDEMFDRGTTAFLDDDGKIIIYGTTESDSMQGLQPPAGDNPSRYNKYYPYVENGVHLIAGGGDDQLIGSEHDDVLDGGVGNDTLDGRNGKDSMVGGAGDDTYIVDNTGDVIIENEGEGVDTVKSSVTFTLGQNVDNLTLTGDENIDGTGNDLTNIIEGNAGDNALDGKGGSDLLYGGDGFDRYTSDSGDLIRDTDGKGLVRLRGVVQVGGTRKKDDPENEYKSKDGTFVYRLDGSTLTINGGLIIEDFDNGDLGIRLETEDDDPPPPPSHDPNNSVVRRDPLAFDLDGSGKVETSSLTGSSTYFDIDNDGIAERVGWIAPGDGLLVNDLDGNGTIDNLNELFGGPGANGFEALRVAGDLNNDGVIDSHDAIYDRLKVWTDTNQDGLSQAGELHSLSELGITAINLGHASVDKDSNGNRIIAEGSIVRNGETAYAAAFDLQIDNRVTRDPGSHTINPTVLQGLLERGIDLPMLRGFGSVRDLQTVYAQDDAVLARIRTLATQSAGDVYAHFDLALADWSGLTTLRRSAGLDVNAPLSATEKLWILESFSGITQYKTTIEAQYAQHRSPDVANVNSAYIDERFNALSMHFADRFLAQTVFADAFDGALYSLSGNRMVVGNPGKLTSSLIAYARSITSPEQATVLAEVYSQFRADLHLDEATMAQALAGFPAAAIFRDLLVGTISDISFGHASYSGLEGASRITGTIGADTLRGGGGNDTLTGLAGNDTLDGGTGDDVLDGGAGDDTLFGGTGHNTYRFGLGYGNDTVNAGDGSTGAATDVVQLGPDVSVADVSIERRGNDLFLHLVAGGTLRVVGQFNQDGGTTAAVAEIRFADGTTWDLAAIKTMVQVGTDASQELHGYSGNDTLSAGGGNDWVSGYDGDDVLDGGTGDDSLYGGNGNDILLGGSGHDFLSGGQGSDIYRFRRGDGHDTIYNEDASSGVSSDILEFADGILASDVRATRSSNSLNLVIAGSDDVLTIENYFLSDATSSWTLGAIRFADGTVWTVPQIKAMVQSATDGADELHGYDSTNDELSAGSGDDYLFGHGGNDTLHGDAGNDSIEGGDGDDVLVGGRGDDRLSGGAGADTYLFAAGDGNDTIMTGDWPTGVDTLLLGAGVTPGAVSLARSGNDLIMRMGSGDSIRVAYYFDADGASGSALGTIRFEDGTVWSLPYIKEQVMVGNDLSQEIYGYATDDVISAGGGADTVYGADGNDIIHGDDGDDRIDGGYGDDVLYGDRGNDILTGGSGRDTYRIGRNAGRDTIQNWTNGNGERDTLEFIDGITAAEVTARRDNDDLLLQVGSADDVVRVSAYFNNEAQNSFTFDVIRFSDGTTWTVDQVKAMVLAPSDGNDSLQGYSSDDTLHGGGGADRISGNGGNDTLYGDDGDDALDGGDGDDVLVGGTGNDVLRGGRGSDTYRYSVGDGADRIDNSGNGGTPSTDTLQFTAGVNPTQVTASRAGDDLVLSLSATDSVTVSGYFLSDGATDVALSAIRFADGTIWDVASVKQQVLAATDADQSLIGYASADTIHGGGGNDTLDGRGGNDALFGDDGDDTLSGGEGNDILAGGSGRDYLYGDSGQDSLTGGDGDDVLDGGLGDDTLEGGRGSDALYGGAGDDTFQYRRGDGSDVIYDVSGLSTLVFLDIARDELVMRRDGGMLVIRVANSAGDEIRIPGYFDAVTGLALASLSLLTAGASAMLSPVDLNLEVLKGTIADDTIYGDRGANQIDGLSGADTVYGREGDDAISGGSGNDSLYGEAGNDRMVGGDGDDLLDGGDGDDDLAGDAGNDRLSGGAGADTLRGGAGDDILAGGAGQDFLDGGAGADNLDGGAGADRMVGGTGDDVYAVDDAGDTVTELSGEGHDLVRSSVSFTLAENVEDLELTGYDSIDGHGNALDNALVGNSGSNRLEGFDGNDVLDGGYGDDILVGGRGNDTYRVDSSADVVIEASGEGYDIVIASADCVLSDNVEELQMDVQGYASSGTGNALDNRIVGNSASNRLDGGLGADTMIGGDGNDTYVVDQVGDVVIEEAGGGWDTVESAIDYALGDTLENLTLTGSANLAGLGNAQDNVLRGNSGNNRLEGGGGADTLYGGLGDDYFVQESVSDRIYEYVGQGVDTIERRFETNLVLTDNVEKLILTEGVVTGNGNQLDNSVTGNAADNKISGLGGNDVLYGLDGNDSLWGGDGADALYGGNGNDYLDGGAGVDRLEGGAGDDVYIVDNAADVVFEAAASGADQVQSSVSYVLSENIENFFLTGSASIDGTANASDNYLAGNAGANVLRGMAGNDTIVGGGGNDTLIGGTGDDKYVFDATSGSDVVDNAGGGNDGVFFTSGVTRERLTFGRDGNDLLIFVDAAATPSVRVTNHFLGGDAAIDYVQPDGGFLLTTAQINQIVAGGSTGGQYDQVIEGTAAAEQLVGSAGKDLIKGLAGDDQLFGMAGDDTLQGDDGNDYLSGGSGSGSGSGNDRLEGGAGNDTLAGEDGDDTLIGGTGDDKYIYGGGKDVIDNTGGGVDGVFFNGGITASRLAFSRDGDDLVITVDGSAASTVRVQKHFLGGDFAIDYVQPASGNMLDTAAINALVGGTTNPGGGTGGNTGNDADYTKTITGTAAGEQLVGTSGRDLIKGLAGNDTLFGMGGDDKLDGGDGDDYLSGGNGSFTGSGNDILIGGAGADTLVGEDGDDMLIGGVGDDKYVYQGASGRDTIDNTGGGTDWLIFNGIDRTRLSFHRSADDLIVLVDGDVNRQVKVKDHFKGGDLAISYVQPSDGFAIPKSQFASLLKPLPTGFAASRMAATPDGQLQRLVEAMALFNPADAAVADTRAADDGVNGSWLTSPAHDMTQSSLRQAV